MRTHCDLLPLFLLGLVITSSIVEASGKKEKNGKTGDEGVNTPTPYPIFIDGAAMAILQLRISSLKSESSKEKDGKMSSDDIANFKKRNEGDLGTTMDLHEQGDMLCVDNASHAIQGSDSDFIVKSSEQEQDADEDSPINVCIDKPLDVMEEVEVPSNSLMHTTSESEALSLSEEMHDVPSETCDRRTETSLIIERVGELFDNDQTDQIPQFLGSLEGQVSWGVDRYVIGVQAVFLQAAGRQSAVWTSYCKGHPAIHAGIYGNTLVCVGGKDPFNEFFETLLRKADMDDLEVALVSNIEGSENEKFRAVIQKALTKADVGGTRLNFPIMTAWMTRNILDEDLNIGMSTVITNTIITYITNERLPSRRHVNEDLSSVEEGEQFITDNSSARKISHSSSMNIEDEDDQEEMIMTQEAQLPNLLGELIDEGGLLETIQNIGERMSSSRFWVILLPLITTIQQYIRMHDFLKINYVLDNFLADGSEVVVTAVIHGSKMGDALYIDSNTISYALRQAFNDGNFDRVICLMVALKERSKLEVGGKFSELSECVSWMLFWAPKDDFGALVKRFLVLHGGELNEKHPVIHQVFCEQLGQYVRKRFNDSEAREFLTDLERQLVPLSVRDFAGGLLEYNGIFKMTFYLEGLEWRELYEALLFNDEERGETLWSIMKDGNSPKCSGDYPSSNDARKAFMSGFKSRRELQMGWLLSELATILERPEDAFNILPSVLWLIVIEYMIQ